MNLILEEDEAQALRDALEMFQEDNPVWFALAAVIEKVQDPHGTKGHNFLQVVRREAFRAGIAWQGGSATGTGLEAACRLYPLRVARPRVVEVDGVRFLGVPDGGVRLEQNHDTLSVCDGILDLYLTPAQVQAVITLAAQPVELVEVTELPPRLVDLPAPQRLCNCLEGGPYWTEGENDGKCMVCGGYRRGEGGAQ